MTSGEIKWPLLASIPTVPPWDVRSISINESCEVRLGFVPRVSTRGQRISTRSPWWLADSLCASRPWPGIFCLVAHQSKIACQAEVSVNWQDAPVTFQLERASVLQPSGQISENRSSRAELSGIRKASLYQTPNAPLTLTSGTAGGSARAAEGRQCDGTKWCSVGHGQTVCTLLASKGKRHWHWLIFLTLLNMKRVVGSSDCRGFHSPRWATPVVCTEHGPLKCTLTFIRISLTPIMGEPARREQENISSDHSHLQLLSNLWKMFIPTTEATQYTSVYFIYKK